MSILAEHIGWCGACLASTLTACSVSSSCLGEMRSERRSSPKQWHSLPSTLDGERGEPEPAHCRCQPHGSEFTESNDARMEGKHRPFSCRDARASFSGANQKSDHRSGVRAHDLGYRQVNGHS